MRAPLVKPASLLLNVSLLALEIVIASWLVLKAEDLRTSEPASAEPSPSIAPTPATAPERQELAAAASASTAEAPPLPVNDALWYGRVVEAEGRQPIARADVRVFAADADADASTRRPVLSRAISDAAGDFLAEFPSRVRGVAAWVEVEGFTPAIVAVTTGTSADAPHVVALARSARLVATVLDGRSPPLPVITVRSSVETAELARDLAGPIDLGWLEWSADTDGGGACRFDALAAAVPIAIELVRDDITVFSQPEPIVLAPGEERAIIIAYNGGITLRGRVIDQDGRAVASLPLCMVENDLER